MSVVQHCISQAANIQTLAQLVSQMVQTGHDAGLLNTQASLQTYNIFKADPETYLRVLEGGYIDPSDSDCAVSPTSSLSIALQNSDASRYVDKAHQPVFFLPGVVVPNVAVLLACLLQFVHDQQFADDISVQAGNLVAESFPANMNISDLGWMSNNAATLCGLVTAVARHIREYLFPGLPVKGESVSDGSLPIEATLLDALTPVMEAIGTMYDAVDALAQDVGCVFGTDLMDIALTFCERGSDSVNVPVAPVILKAEKAAQLKQAPATDLSKGGQKAGTQSGKSGSKVASKNNAPRTK